MTAKWIKISDSGHLLIEKQSSPSRPPNSIPVLGSLLERLKGTAISLVPGGLLQDNRFLSIDGRRADLT